MKVPLNWLKEFVDITLSPADIANRLTMAGTEVKGIQIIGGDWENIVVGQITAINPHPNADRLTLPIIDLGIEQATVVCGAPNLSIGNKVVFAHVGAQLVDGHSGEVFRLKSAKIRGVVSHGMVCSEKELGISDSHQEILVLPPEAPLGTPLAEYLGDAVLDLDVTPNRPDCLSMIGIARETAALTGQSVHLPEATYSEGTTPVEGQISVEIAAPDLCPRYCASLITGVKVGESPKWLQQRLMKCGMRPINNIVDITNYVMLEYGQPLHAFDYHQIGGGKIIVRRAAVGEVMVTLDGVERVLSSDMLVIADENQSLAIAGVMGGANSEVTEQTTAILLEAASFNPDGIHYAGRTMRLPSESCMRFERGIRPELALPAIKRATQLILQLAGGEMAKGLIDIYPGKLTREPISLSTNELKRLLGVGFSLERIVDALSSLGFDCKQTGSKSDVLVAAPYWRSDIHRSVDLVEEVIRMVGYDKIPTTMLSQPLPRQKPDPIIKLKQKIGRNLTGYGFQEVITYSLTSLELLNRLQPKPHPLDPMPLKLANPMTLEQEYLRHTLRANLLVALSANRRHEDGGIRLFELGKVYRPRHKDLPDEGEVLCGILNGPRLEKSWHGGDELLDFFDAKGVVEGLLSQLGVVADFKDGEDESLHPDKQVAIVVTDNRLGVVGELHPRVVQAFDIDVPVYLFEIDLTVLLSFTLDHRMFQPILRFPAIVRDIALVVAGEVPHQKVQDIVKGYPLVERINIFDVYSGEQVPAGKKCLVYRLTFQSATHTLTDEEVNHVQQQILNKLGQEFGATLRS
jgi:phenylalanyl-tRNA synthetase beta chain